MRRDRGVASDEPAGDHDEQQRREHAEEDDHLRLLEQLDRVRPLGDADQVVVRDRLHLFQARLAVVEQQRREREDERGRVAGEHDPAVEPSAHMPRRVREHGVSDERVAEVSEQEEDREENGAVGVAELPREPRDAGGDEQRAEHVRRSADPGEQADGDERPADRDLRRRALVRREQVVHLHPVGGDAEEGTAQDHDEPPHVRIVTYSEPRFQGPSPVRVGDNPRSLAPGTRLRSQARPDVAGGAGF